LPPDTITTTEYNSLQEAYDHFNRELFGGTLPAVLITLQRHAKAAGYFAPDRFKSRNKSLMHALTSAGTTHELALNPDGFTNQTDREILDTLVHEMCHVWQQEHGTPPRRCYHDREWSRKMQEVGLMPSSTGRPGGKTTGPKMSDYVIEGGPFARSFERLAAAGFRLHWQSQAPPSKERDTKRASKTKYTCGDCGANAWAKPGAQLVCAECNDVDDAERMEAAE
jgi:predicted SprT family Zn-dependent metalloprotease